MVVKMNCCLKNRLLFFVLCSAQAVAVHAEELVLAVAANFMKPMDAIVAEFEDATGHEVRVTYGASGRLYAQIVNGAPFQMFFSADQDKPAALVEGGHAQAESRYTYATGTLVLWSADASLDMENGTILDSPGMSRLAIANPRLAPYGEAAEQVLAVFRSRGIAVPVIVMGENISQAFQFVETGNAAAGLVALSQVMENGTIRKGAGWIIPPEYHDPIRQDAVITTRGIGHSAVQEFMDFFNSAKVRTILSDYGYSTD